MRCAETLCATHFHKVQAKGVTSIERVYSFDSITSKITVTQQKIHLHDRNTRITTDLKNYGMFKHFKTVVLVA